jgi:serine protease
MQKLNTKYILKYACLGAFAGAVFVSQLFIQTPNTTSPTPEPLHITAATTASTQLAGTTPVQAAPVLTKKPHSVTTSRSNTAVAATTTHPGLPNYPHPQYKYTTLGTPTGPLYSQEGFLNRVSAQAGWDSATASDNNPPTTIAVIDTGFALNHENLTNRWKINNAEADSASTDAIDNDQDGYIDNWRGWNFIANSNNPMAGLMNPAGASVTHGSLTSGLAGLIDSRAKIMPLQALDDAGNGYTDDISAAIHYATDHGAKIINLSLGSTSDDSYLHEQILYAVSKGVLVVAASGNNGCNCMLYPAAYPEVLAVGASSPTDTVAAFSNYGTNLDVLAPGVNGDVCSSTYTQANPTTAYSCNYYGTSLSTPIVSGLAALLKQECPSCSSSIVTDAILFGADIIPSMNGARRTNSAGYGRINVAGAVAAINQSLATHPTHIGDFTQDGAVNVFDLSLMIASWKIPDPDFDLKPDGQINVYDLSIILQQWTG